MQIQSFAPPIKEVEGAEAEGGGGTPDITQPALSNSYAANGKCLQGEGALVRNSNDVCEPPSSLIKEKVLTGGGDTFYRRAI